MLTEFVLCVVLGYFFYQYLKGNSQWKNAPPGPLPLPVFGNLIQLALASPVPTLGIAKFAKTYGEIFRLKFGFTNFVVLSSYEAITEVLSMEEAQGRDLRGTLYDRIEGKNVGLVFSEGEVWNTTRRWSIRNLRELGMNKSAIMEPGVQSEVSLLIKKIDKCIPMEDTGTKIMNFAVLDADKLFPHPVTKVVWMWIVGHYDAEDEQNLEHIIEENGKMFRSMTVGAGFGNAYPTLRYLFPKWTFHEQQMKLFKFMRGVASRILHQETERSEMDSNMSPNLTEAYVKSNIPKELFNEFHYQTLFMDLIQAAADTSSSFLEAAVLFLILYPDVQKKIYEEILRNFPKGQDVEYNDKKMLVYTSAVMLEVHRHTKVVPLYVPRRAVADFYYKNYFIPKGTPIMPDLESHYTDTKYWKDPYEFNPDRFIKLDGGGLNELEALVIPFGVGKRICPGEHLGEMTTFFILVSLVRNFLLEVDHNSPEPRRDLAVGITSRPYPFKIRVSRRQQD